MSRILLVISLLATLVTALPATTQHALEKRVAALSAKIEALEHEYADDNDDTIDESLADEDVKEKWWRAVRVVASPIARKLPTKYRCKTLCTVNAGTTGSACAGAVDLNTVTAGIAPGTTMAPKMIMALIGCGQSVKKLSETCKKCPACTDTVCIGSAMSAVVKKCHSVSGHVGDLLKEVCDPIISLCGSAKMQRKMTFYQAMMRAKMEQ